MYERVRKCPNCGANLAASRFARSTRCPFCASEVLLDPSAVGVARFREARAAWEDPATVGVREASRIGGAAWLIGPMIAVGAGSDVHLAVRARAPSELAIVRLARGPAAARLDAAWATLGALHSSTARGAATLTRRLPEPIARGVVEAGPHGGREALVARAPLGHPATLADLGAPIDARASVWVWRRVLEILAFVHGAGSVHGAVTPAHVLIEAGEHGARLLGYGNAGAPGRAPVVEDRWRAIAGGPTSVSEDLRASARTIRWALGDELSRLPVPYADLLRAVATDGRSPQGDADAWSLRERIGRLAASAFGPPSFHPLLSRR
jgi:hypothetical protein